MRQRTPTGLVLAGLIVGLGACTRAEPIVLHPVASTPVSTPRGRVAHAKPRPAGESTACTSEVALRPAEKEALFRAFTAEQAGERSAGTAPAPGGACHAPKS